MTAFGFCVVAALSEPRKRLPLTRSFKIGNCRRITWGSKGFLPVRGSTSAPGVRSRAPLDFAPCVRGGRMLGSFKSYHSAPGRGEVDPLGSLASERSGSLDSRRSVGFKPHQPSPPNARSFQSLLKIAHRRKVRRRPAHPLLLPRTSNGTALAIPGIGCLEVGRPTVGTLALGNEVPGNAALENEGRPAKFSKDGGAAAGRG